MVFQIGSICLVKCLLACNHLFDIVSLFWKRYSYISSFFRKAGKSPGFTHSLKAANNFLFYWIILSISWADFVAFKDLFLFKTKFFSTNWKEQKFSLQNCLTVIMLEWFLYLSMILPTERSSVVSKGWLAKLSLVGILR